MLMTTCEWPDASAISKNRKPAADKMSPAMARPRPSCSSGCSLICDKRDERKNESENVERKSAAATNQRQRQNPENQTGVAKEFVFGICPAVEIPGVSGAIGGGAPCAKQLANSGSRPTKFQSFAPSTKTGVRLSTRLSAIHCRNCSAVDRVRIPCRPVR